MFNNSELEIVAFSGWGQKYNSLEHIFQNNAFKKLNKKLTITSIDYSKFFSFADLSQNIISSASNYVPNIIIGWSLGGQLALRLVAKKIFNPALIILIAPPSVYKFREI